MAAAATAKSNTATTLHFVGADLAPTIQAQIEASGAPLNDALPPNSIFTDAAVRAQLKPREVLSLTTSARAQAIAYGLACAAALALLILLGKATVQQSVTLKSLLVVAPAIPSAPSTGRSASADDSLLILPKFPLPGALLAEKPLRVKGAEEMSDNQALRITGPASEVSKLPAGVLQAAVACDVTATKQDSGAASYAIVPVELFDRRSVTAAWRPLQCVTIQFPVGRESLGRWAISTISARERR